MPDPTSIQAILRNWLSRSSSANCGAPIEEPERRSRPAARCRATEDRENRRHQWRRRRDQRVDAETASEVERKHRVEQRFGDRRALNDRGGSPHVAEQRGEIAHHGRHRKEAEIGRRQQPGKDEDGGELDAGATELRDADPADIGGG